MTDIVDELKQMHRLSIAWSDSDVLLKAADEIERLRRDEGHHPSGLLKASDVVDWAVSRWQAEVANRPLRNQNRRPLDDTWRQIIRQFGGDDVILCGPTHDDLLNNTRVIADVETKP